MGPFLIPKGPKDFLRTFLLYYLINAAHALAISANS